MKKKKIISAATLLLASSFVLHNALANQYTSNSDNKSESITLAKQAENLNPKVVEYALNGFNYAKHNGEVTKNILTVVDFSQHG